MISSISVIIPTYNRAALILEAVDSVLAQEFANIEVIVIDDGSTDNTASVLKKYSESGKLVYKWQENAGRSEARNYGARISSGEYLLFLDSDDLLEPAAINNLAALAAHNERSKVFGGLVGFFSKPDEIDLKNRFNFSSSFTDQQITVGVIKDIFLSIGAFVIHREAFFEQGGFLKKFEPGEDLDFSIKSLHNNLITWSSDFLVVRKRRHDSNTDDTLMHKASERTCKFYISLLRENALPNFIKDKRKMLATFYLRLFNDSLYLLQRSKGTHRYAAAIAYDPTNLFKWKLLKLFVYLWVTKKKI